MSNAYKFLNPDGMYFITSTVVGWIDVFTREEYRQILLDSFKYCQENKGLEIFAWVLMTNHFHMIARAKQGSKLEHILRDMKKITSRRITKAIIDNPKESRKEWMKYLFERYGKYNPNNTLYQFWQQDNHPIEIWSQDVIKQKLDYIHNNPVKNGFVSEAKDYKYSSAIDLFLHNNL
jgi:putative transposase